MLKEGIIALWTILVFTISFLIGFAFCYNGVKDDIKESKSLEELKIKYYCEGGENI